MSRLDFLEGEPMLLAPIKKLPDGASIGASGVVVRNIRHEKFDESPACLGASHCEGCRQRELTELDEVGRGPDGHDFRLAGSGSFRVIESGHIGSDNGRYVMLYRVKY